MQRSHPIKIIQFNLTLKKLLKKKAKKKDDNSTNNGDFPLKLKLILHLLESYPQDK